MYSFGANSMTNLLQCRPPLVEVALKVIKIADHSIVKGYRNEADQARAFMDKKSFAQFGQSPHNFEK